MLVGMLEVHLRHRLGHNELCLGVYNYVLHRDRRCGLDQGRSATGESNNRELRDHQIDWSQRGEGQRALFAGVIQGTASGEEMAAQHKLMSEG